MWKVTLETQQSETVVNNILDQTNKLEPAQYLHAELFITTLASLIKAIKKGFMKIWPGIIENLINIF